MSKPKYIIETCTGSAESVKESAIGGADRVELCCSLPEGGCTPSYGEIWKATSQTPTVPVMVMIRPRGGDFLYSSDEIDIMCSDIDQIKKLENKVHGFIFGCLTSDGEIDVQNMKKLISHCKPGFSVTCHRAFDMCRDASKALEQLIELGVDRVLTSGQQMTAEIGIPKIKQLVEQANGRITIMPGCGVDENNIRKIADETGAREFHAVCGKKVKSGMKYHNEDVSMSGAGSVVVIDEFMRTVSSAEVIRETRMALGE